MSLKFQTMANEYFEIVIILKNQRTVKWNQRTVKWNLNPVLYEEAYFWFFLSFVSNFRWFVFSKKQDWKWVQSKTMSSKHFSNKSRLSEKFQDYAKPTTPRPLPLEHYPKATKPRPLPQDHNPKTTPSNIFKHAPSIGPLRASLVVKKYKVIVCKV